MNRMRRKISHIAFRGRRAFICLAGTALCLSSVVAQSQITNGAALPSLPSAEAVISRDTNPYSGSIPQGKATGETIDLTVEDALDRGTEVQPRPVSQ